MMDATLEQARRVNSLLRRSFLDQNPAGSVHPPNTPSEKSYESRLNRELVALKSAPREDGYIPSADSPLNALLARASVEEAIDAQREILREQRRELAALEEENLRDAETLRELREIAAGLQARIEGEKSHGERDLLKDRKERGARLARQFKDLMKRLIVLIDTVLAPILAAEAAGHRREKAEPGDSREGTKMKELLERLMNCAIADDPWVQLREDSASSRMLVRSGAAVYAPGDTTKLRLVAYHKRI